MAATVEYVAVLWILCSNRFKNKNQELAFMGGEGPELRTGGVLLIQTGWLPEAHVSSRSFGSLAVPLLAHRLCTHSEPESEEDQSGSGLILSGRQYEVAVLGHFIFLFAHDTQGPGW